MFSQVFQVADRLADQGFTVGVPDLFGDDAWKMSEFPPPDKQKFMQWIHTKGDVGKTAVKVHQTREYLHKECSATLFGVIGFCWGSSVSLHLASAQPRQAIQCDEIISFERHLIVYSDLSVIGCILMSSYALCEKDILLSGEMAHFMIRGDGR